MKEAKLLLGSYARTFLAASLALAFSGVTDPKKLIWAGLTAVLPPVIRWLNPNDKSFGIKK